MGKLKLRNTYENRHVNKEGEGEGGMNWESSADILGKEMATHSSVLAWRIPGTGEPGGLPSMGSCRVQHD